MQAQTHTPVYFKGTGMHAYIQKPKVRTRTKPKDCQIHTSFSGWSCATSLTRWLSSLYIVHLYFQQNKDRLLTHGNLHYVIYCISCLAALCCNVYTFTLLCPTVNTVLGCTSQSQDSLVWCPVAYLVLIDLFTHWIQWILAFLVRFMVVDF